MRINLFCHYIQNGVTLHIAKLEFILQNQFRAPIFLNEYVNYMSANMAVSVGLRAGAEFVVFHAKIYRFPSMLYVKNVCHY